MTKLNKIGNKLTTMTGRTGLLLKKKSPEILMVAGVVGVVASTVLACKATLKMDDIVDEASNTLYKINEAFDDLSDPEHEMHGDYTEQDVQKDKVIVYVQTAVKVARIYGPAVILGVGSVGMIIGSHNIMKKRNVAMVAAYKVLDESFKDYRRRVVEDFGKDVDRNFKNGIRQEMMDVTTVDAKGKEKTTKEQVETIEQKEYSQYAKFFDDGCSNWSKEPEYNLLFLKAQQNYANDLLKSRGHVFLNEVYDMLGIRRTKEGSVVGWALGAGDDFVDFGMYDLHHTKTRDFVNGYEHSILLDFNVDGLIYDLI